MGEYSATHIGKESVLSFFETEAETPFFSLWVKSQKQTQYNGNDMDKAVEKLEHWLSIYEKENFDKIVILKLHSDKEKEYTLKSGVLSQIYFKIGEAKPVITGNDTSAYLINEINNLRAELNALKLKEQPEEDEEEEEEEDPTQRTIQGVLGALEHPVISGLLTKMFSTGQPVARNLAGTDTAEQYVQILFSKGVTLEHLRKLAEMPEAKIKMLITML